MEEERTQHTIKVYLCFAYAVGKQRLSVDGE